MTPGALTPAQRLLGIAILCVLGASGMGYGAVAVVRLVAAPSTGSFVALGGSVVALLGVVLLWTSPAASRWFVIAGLAVFGAGIVHRSVSSSWLSVAGVAAAVLLCLVIVDERVMLHGSLLSGGRADP